MVDALDGVEPFLEEKICGASGEEVMDNLKV